MHNPEAITSFFIDMLPSLRPLRSLRQKPLYILIGHSALASLGVFASLWVANPRKGRLRQHYNTTFFAFS